MPITLADRTQSAAMGNAIAAVAVRMEAGFYINGYNHETSVTTQAYRHHFDAVGSQTRARLAIATSASLGLPAADAEWLAAAVELLHNASLIQDDYQDQSPTRRGLTAVWLKFGVGAALGLTDRLITAAFVCLSHVSQPRHFPALIAQMHSAVAETIDGQIAEIPPLAQESTVQLAAAGKSGPLFALALELPLIAAGEERFVATAHEAALRFGLGYQICDDLQDIEQDRFCGMNTNLVLALEDKLSPDAARERGKSLAADCFNRTIEVASRLPGDSGAALQILADQALARLEP